VFDALIVPDVFSLIFQILFAVIAILADRKRRRDCNR